MVPKLPATGFASSPPSPFHSEWDHQPSPPSEHLNGFPGRTSTGQSTHSRKTARTATVHYLPQSIPRPACGFAGGAPLELFPPSPPPQGAPRLRSGTAPAAHVRSGLLSRGETRQGPPSLKPQGTPIRFPPAPPIL